MPKRDATRDHRVRRQPAGCRRPPLLYQEGIRKPFRSAPWS